jgi:hypothetical protein
MHDTLPETPLSLHPACRRSVVKRRLADQPVMRLVPADLALEAQAYARTRLATPRRGLGRTTRPARRISCWSGLCRSCDRRAGDAI